MKKDYIKSIYYLMLMVMLLCAALYLGIGAKNGMIIEDNKAKSFCASKGLLFDTFTENKVVCTDSQSQQQLLFSDTRSGLLQVWIIIELLLVAAALVGAVFSAREMLR